MPKELHVCAGLNACYQHGKSGTNQCAGTGDCATVVNNSCHGNNDCRGQGGCGGGGSLGSQQTAPGDNLCAGAGSCRVPSVGDTGPQGGIDAHRIMGAQDEQGKAKHPGGPINQPIADTAITGPYEGRHVWQVARLLFEQRMIAQGRSFTNDLKLLGPKTPGAKGTVANGFSAANYDYNYFGPPPPDMALGPNTNAAPVVLTDRPVYSNVPPTS
jgi:hypothetical protein